MNQLPDLTGTSADVMKAIPRRLRYLRHWLRHYAKVRAYRHADSEHFRLIEETVEYLIEKRDAEYWLQIAVGRVLLPRADLRYFDPKLWKFTKKCQTRWAHLIGYGTHFRQRQKTAAEPAKTI